jgi:hypothetical protein
MDISNMLAEVPTKVDYYYSGRMKLVVFARAGGPQAKTNSRRCPLGHGGADYFGCIFSEYYSYVLC